MGAETNKVAFRNALNESVGVRAFEAPGLVVLGEAPGLAVPGEAPDLVVPGEAPGLVVPGLDEGGREHLDCCPLRRSYCRARRFV